MEEVFWLNDVSILYKNYKTFVPSLQFSLKKNLNAIVRFFIYYSLVHYVIYDDREIFQTVLLVMFITVVLYYLRPYIKENFKNIETMIRTSTKDNPMMNLSVMDFNNNNEQQIVIDKTVSNETINKNLTSHLYDDINKKNIFERQFYTMPVTTVPNDQVAFAKWLYDKGPTCKEKTTECINTIPDRLAMGRASAYSAS